MYGSPPCRCTGTDIPQECIQQLDGKRYGSRLSRFRCCSWAWKTGEMVAPAHEKEPPHIDNEYEIITRYEKTQWAFRLDLCDVSVFAWHTASKHQRCRNSHLTTNHCQKFCDSRWISLKIGYSVTSKITPGQWSCLYHSKCHPNVGCVFIICTRWLSTWSIEMLTKKYAAGLMLGISSYPTGQPIMESLDGPGLMKQPTASWPLCNAYAIVIASWNTSYSYGYGVWGWFHGSMVFNYV